MSTHIRAISISGDYAGTPRNDRLQAWLKANDVNPEDIPAAHPLEVNYEENTLQLVVFHKDAEGNRVLGPKGTDDGYLKLSRLVPLLSAPEDHNL